MIEILKMNALKSQPRSKNKLIVRLLETKKEKKLIHMLKTHQYSF
jgi:hypothetical protein